MSTQQPPQRAKTPARPAGSQPPASAPPTRVAASDEARRTSPDAIAFLHQWESCRLEAYPDPGSVDGNPWTIGWGTTRINGQPVQRGMRITQAQADEFFREDLRTFEQEVTRLTRGVSLTQNQFDALVVLVYNIGAGAFAGSTIRRMILAGDFAGAQLQFHRWNRNDGRPMRGLSRRRFGEAIMFGPRNAAELRALLPSAVLLHLA